MTDFNFKVSLSDSNEEMNFKFRIGGERQEVHIRENYLKEHGIRIDIKPDELANLIADKVLDEVSEQPFKTLKTLKDAKLIPEKNSKQPPSEMETEILEERDALYKKRLQKELDSAFGYKKIGRGKGVLNKETPKYSKTQFIESLNKAIYDLSASGDKPTQTQVAHFLGYVNSKALKRTLKRFGDNRRWQTICDDAPNNI